MIFPNPNSPFSLAVAQHHENCDMAIAQLISLYKKGYDIYDPDLYCEVFEFCGIAEDGFSDQHYIFQRVKEELWVQ